MVYDDFMLRCAKARQRELWNKAQRQTLLRQLQADMPRRTTRWLLEVGQALMACGVSLRTWCEARLTSRQPTTLLPAPLARRVAWRHHEHAPKRRTP